MTTIDTTVTPSTVLDDARRIAAGLRDRAAAIEAARRVPPDVLRQLVEAGCFRILLPRSHGGLEGTLPQALELYERLATGDASTAWITMIGGGAWCDLASLPRPTFDALFPRDGDPIVAGVFAPTGSITKLDGAYELTGRWAFASGCEHATVLYVNAVEGFADGHPMLRASVLDRADVVVEDTWHVAGLCGTGSQHLSVSGAVIPQERTFVPLVDPPCVDVPAVRVPLPSLIASAIASVAIGTARGALDEAIELAQGKVPLLAPGPLATSPLFHHDLARAEAGLAAGRALLAESAGRLWEQATTGDEATLDDRARARSAAAWATEAALAATEAAYRAGGGSALYDDCPLQRRLRDVHAITQHFLVRPETYTAAGAVLAGQPLPVPVF